MRILVTGGSGYLGTHVCRFFDAFNFSRRNNHDILNIYDLARVAHYDVVIHLAAHLDKDPRQPKNVFASTPKALPTSCATCGKARSSSTLLRKTFTARTPTSTRKCRRLARTAYCGQSAFEWSKLIGERYVEYYAAERDLRACIFRMSTVYARPSEGNEPGFVTHYVESVKRGLPLRLPAEGAPRRDILHVDDFSRACRAFIDSSLPRGMYNIGGGRENAASLREIVERVGRMIELVPKIEDAAHTLAPVPLNYVSDLARIRAELGWQPETGIEEGLRSLL